MQTLTPKDPAEQIPITFDFSELLSAVNTATLQCKVITGTDASPSSMLSGAAVLSGASVKQTIIGGLAGVTYSIRCTATGPEGVFLLAARLTVTVDE